MKADRHAGFSLLEILIVVSVLGVLTGMVVPQFINARSNAHNSAAQVYSRNLALWLASAEAGSETPLSGTLIGSCLSMELQTQGAPDTFPGSVSDCEIAFEAGRYQVKVTSVSKKGGLADNGVFITYY